MLKVGRITGTLTIDDLDDATFNFVFIPARKQNGVSVGGGELTISGGLMVSDWKHRVAAHKLAREFQITVVWQDIAGNKHYVKPKDRLDHLEKDLSIFDLDPRDVFVPESMSVC
jgi:hypothetical protein